jgi:hypothetical protein
MTRCSPVWCSWFVPLRVPQRVWLDGQLLGRRWFTEGCNTLDLKQAKALLEEPG